MRQIFIVIVATLVALPAVARAQAKPDFSGSWTLSQGRGAGAPAPARGGRGGGGRGGAGAVPGSLTITETPTQITIERAMTGGVVTSAVYNLDGRVSGNLLGDVFLSKSTVSWDGVKLVIATTKDFGEVASGGITQENAKDVYSLDNGVLTVTTTLPGPSAIATGAQTRTLTYNRK